MEYSIYECKKALRKYRVHILLGLLSLVPIGLFIYFLAGKKNGLATVYFSDYSIIKTYVRKGKQYYTQGLMFKDENTLIESAGVYKESAIHYLNLQNMTVDLETRLDDKYFGEGCQLIENNGEQEIYQLTWKERKILVWDALDLSEKRVLDLPIEIRQGWGISKRMERASDGEEQTVLYISDGTSKIFAVDPVTLEVKRTIQVRTHDEKEVRMLNELEFVKGYLWANIYYTNNIALINVDTGYVDYMIDLKGLDALAKDEAEKLGLKIQNDYVLNGIAYDSDGDRLIIAGKKWPLMWEIKVDGI